MGLVPSRTGQLTQPGERTHPATGHRTRVAVPLASGAWEAGSRLGGRQIGSKRLPVSDACPGARVAGLDAVA